MARTRLFVSFDFDNDRTLKEFIIGQARLADSPFDVTDVSLKEAAPQRDWEAKARRAIAARLASILETGPPASGPKAPPTTRAANTGQSTRPDRA